MSLPVRTLLFVLLAPRADTRLTQQYASNNAISVEMKTTTEFRSDDTPLERVVRLGSDSPGYADGKH